MKKSSFSGWLVLKYLNGREWEVVNPKYGMTEFCFYSSRSIGGEYIYVADGFITDFASIPRVFWSIMPPVGGGARSRYGKAAVIHDFLYYKGVFSRKDCDKMFLEAMEVLQVSKWKRKAMYRAVRWFGGKAWKKHRKNDV